MLIGTHHVDMSIHSGICLVAHIKITLDIQNAHLRPAMPSPACEVSRTSLFRHQLRLHCRRLRLSWRRQRILQYVGKRCDFRLCARLRGPRSPVERKSTPPPCACSSGDQPDHRRLPLSGATTSAASAPSSQLPVQAQGDPRCSIRWQQACSGSSHVQQAAPTAR
jgi:hypothetical protein